MAFKIQRFIPASPLTMPDPDPKDPKDPKDSKKKYGKATVKKDKNEYGFNRITVSHPYTTTTNGKRTNKSYKQLAKEGGDVAAAKEFNKNKTSSGVETRTMLYGDAKPAGVQISASTPKPKIDLSKKPSIKAPSARDIHKARLSVKKMEYQDWKEEKYQKFKQDRAHKKPYTEAERQRDIKISKKNKNKRKRKNLFKVDLNLGKRVSRGSNFKQNCK